MKSRLRSSFGSIGTQDNAAVTGQSSERRAEHLAALYQSGNFIVERVVSFIAEGLAAAEHVLVLCTMAHWNTIASRLHSGGIGYGRATADGRLVFVDAEELLAAMSEHGGVSVDRFGQLLQPLLKPAVRVYGEVVSHASERIWVESGESVVFT